MKQFLSAIMATKAAHENFRVVRQGLLTDLEQHWSEPLRRRASVYHFTALGQSLRALAEHGSAARVRNARAAVWNELRADETHEVLFSCASRYQEIDGFDVVIDWFVAQLEAFARAYVYRDVELLAQALAGTHRSEAGD